MNEPKTIIRNYQKSLLTEGDIFTAFLLKNRIFCNIKTKKEMKPYRN